MAATGGAALLPGDEDDAAAMLAATAAFRRLEPTTPARDLQPAVDAHLRLVGRRAGRGPTYAAAAAEVARFGAWLAWDQRDHQRARVLYRQAARYADRSGSQVAAAYMRGSWALWAAETGQAVEALRIGRQVPGVPAIRPWLATMRATVSASTGDADEALTALRDAERALKVEQQPPSWSFIYPFSASKLQAYTGRCYVRLGLHKAAVPALREALHGTPRTKQRAVLLLDLARAVGDGDEARELVAEARQIGEEFQSRKVLART
jgi:tetratricopeptide (TPR) repeat protein